MNAVLVFLLAKIWLILVSILTALLFSKLPAVASTMVIVAAAGGVPLLLTFHFLRRKGLQLIAGFNKPGAWRSPWLIWLPLLYVLVNLANLLRSSAPGHVDGEAVKMILTQGLSVPMLEESVFRGVILALLLRRYNATKTQILGSVLFSAVLFGCWHIPIGPSPDNWQQTLARIIYTFFFGVCYAAILLRTRSIWLGMISHSLTLAASLTVGAMMSGKAAPISQQVTQEGATGSAFYTVLSTVPLLLYGLYLLRSVTPMDVSESLAASFDHTKERKVEN